LGFPFRTHPLGTYKKPSVQESLLAHITSYIMNFKTATKNIFRSKFLILSMLFFVAIRFLIGSEKVSAEIQYTPTHHDQAHSGNGSLFQAYQLLGNGLSGTPTALGGYLVSVGGDTHYARLNLVECLGPGYTNCGDWMRADSVISGTGAYSNAITQDFSGGNPMDPTRYYYLKFEMYTSGFAGLGHDAYGGSSADTYSAGSCDDTSFGGLSCNGVSDYYFTITGASGAGPNYQDTHIISLIPGGFSATTSPFTFSFDFYNGTTTPEGDLDFQLRDQNINQFDPLGQLIREDHAPLTYIEGTHTYSASFTAYPSNYSLTATIFDRLGNTVEATTTYFSITSDSSGLGGQPFYGSYATTTGFFYGGYSEASSTNIVIAALSNVVTGMKYKIPWGYVFLIYDRISIDLASTSQSVPTFTMTIPGTSVITTSHSNQDLTFNLNHVGDIYATTTIMANGSTFKSQFDGIVRGILWAMFAWSVWVYFVHRRNQEIV